MKSGVPTLVDGCQTKGALEVLSKEAEKAESPMKMIQPLEKDSFPPTQAGDLDPKAQSEFGPTTSDVYQIVWQLILFSVQMGFNEKEMIRHCWKCLKK